MLLLAPLLIGASAGGNLDLRIEQLRSARGLVRVCLTRDPASFPNCQEDPKALKLSVPAGSGGRASFAYVEPGTYALALLHDENGNGRLDTLMKLPREGFGFSRNPAIRFGPPRFREARFAVGAGANRQTIRVRYLL